MCHSAAERRIPSPVSVGQMFMHLIMNRWSDFNTIRIMSEVMIDYVSVSLLLFCVVFFFVSARSSQHL